MHIHVLKVCCVESLSSFGLKIINFKSCSKIRPKSLYYSTGSLSKIENKRIITLKNSDEYTCTCSRLL